MSRDLSPLEGIVSRLYSRAPKDTLYHYTSIGGALSITASGELWATEVRYMSDASELRNASDLLVRAAAQRVHAGEGDSEVMLQFAKWIEHRVTLGHKLFVACFSERGNWLSQWRGYSQDGKGISLGFPPGDLVQAAELQGFHVVKCVYNRSEQVALAHEVVEAVESFARSVGPAPASKVNPTQSYVPAFSEIEDELLRIAVVLKYGAFHEEEEWRAVSPITKSNEGVRFREGVSMIVPYVPFRLPREGAKLKLQDAFLGPTPHPNLAMASLLDLLSGRVAAPVDVWSSGIPYRTW